MSLRRRALWALGAVPGLAKAVDPAQTWEAQLRWVRWAVPPGVQGSPAQRTWSTRQPEDAVETLAPRLRLSVGAEAAWVVSRPAGTLAWVDLGRVQLPMAWPSDAVAEPPAGQRLWVRLEAVRAPGAAGRVGSAGPEGSDRSVRVALRWDGPEAAGATEAWHTTLWVPSGRWTTVMRHDEPAPPPATPGEWRSRDAAPRRSRELQLYISPLLP